MFIFNFSVVLFCHPAPELSPVFLTKPGSGCRGTEEKAGFFTLPGEGGGGKWFLEGFGP